MLHDGQNPIAERGFEKDEIVNLVYGKNIISHIKFLVEKEGSPAIFYANVIGVLHRVLRLDGSRCLAIVS